MKQILIIDDNEDYRKMLKLLFEKEGFYVDEADNGIRGCEMCFKKIYDIVLVDLILPGKDGVKVINVLKEEFSDSIKIIAISGAAVSTCLSEYVFIKSSEYGADCTYKKTDNLKILLNKIKSLCN